MLRILIGLAVAGLLLGLAVCAQAQTEPPSTIYPKVTVYDMQQDVIEAPVEVPSMSVIEQRREVRQASLIRLRQDYRPRVLNSARKL
jgi:hypothetical protein